MMLTPFFCKAEREVQRRLPAELRDGAPAFFAFVNVQHVFQRERLEKKFVARVVIGGNGFRIRVHHHGFKAVLLERERGVDAAVIKLDALADAVRPAAENHHLLRRVALHLVIAAIVGGIIIRRVSLELGGAGVHEPVAGHEADASCARRGWRPRSCRSNGRSAGRRNPSDLALGFAAGHGVFGVGGAGEMGGGALGVAELHGAGFGISVFPERFPPVVPRRRKEPDGRNASSRDLSAPISSPAAFFKPSPTTTTQYFQAVDGFLDLREETPLRRTEFPAAK